MSRDQYTVDVLALNYGVDGSKELHIYAVEGDPSDEGIDAPIGSVALRENGLTYIKQVSGTSGWVANTGLAHFLDRQHQTTPSQESQEVNVYQQHFNFNFTVAHAADYRISYSYRWGLDTLDRTFRGRLLLNTQEIWLHEQEPYFVDEHLSNSQEAISRYSDIVNLSVGVNSLSFEFMPVEAGVTATVNSAILTVERFI